MACSETQHNDSTGKHPSIPSLINSLPAEPLRFANDKGIAHLHTHAIMVYIFEVQYNDI